MDPHDGSENLAKDRVKRLYDRLVEKVDGLPPDRIEELGEYLRDEQEPKSAHGSGDQPSAMIFDMGKNTSTYFSKIPELTDWKAAFREAEALAEKIADETAKSIARFRSTAQLTPCSVCGSTMEIDDMGSSVFICQHIYNELIDKIPVGQSTLMPVLSFLGVKVFIKRKCDIWPIQ